MAESIDGLHTQIVQTSTSTADRVPFQADVSMGKVDGYSVMFGLGERESMAVVATGEDIWRGNELSPAPTSHISIPIPDSAGEQMTVVSESVNDTAAGSGTRTLMIHYIDTAGAEQDETVTMNGTTGVDTVATDIIFVQYIHTVTAGNGSSPRVADGHIKIYKKGTAGLVYNMIAAGGNMSLVPHRMVPAGKVLTNVTWHCEEAQDRRTAIRIRATSIHNDLLPFVFLFKNTAYIRKATSGLLPVAESFPAFTIIKVSAWGDQAGAEVSVGWSGILAPA